MNGAEVRVLREALGLSPKWVAARLGLASDRHLRAVEAGEAPASVRMVALLHELEARAEAEVEEALATVFEEAGVDEYDEDALEQLDEADWPTIEVPRLDLDGDEFPAGWYRAIAARVRWELGARCWVEYLRADDDARLNPHVIYGDAALEPAYPSSSEDDRRGDLAPGECVKGFIPFDDRGVIELRYENADGEKASWGVE